MHFQIYRDSSAEYRWRLRAANNETMADSAEGYKRKSRAVAAVLKIKEAIFSDAVPIIEQLG